MISSERREALEIRLRAIQDLKNGNPELGQDRRYIGTQSALNYSRQIENLYTIPQKIADNINSRLTSNGSPIYPATTEKILGLSLLFEDLIFYSSDEQDDQRDTEAIYDILNRKFTNSPIFKIYDKIINNNGTEEISKMFYDIFSKVQHNETNTKKFGLIAISELLKYFEINKSSQKYSKIHNNIKTQTTEDWDKILSKKTSDQEKHSRERIYLDNINFSERIERIEKDQIGHRLDIRRELLSDLLSKLPNIKSYKELYDDQKYKLKSRRIRYKKLISMNSPEGFIKDERRMIKDVEFMLPIIVSDRNFIKRLLGETR